MSTPAVFYKDLRIGLKNLLLVPVSLVMAYLFLLLVWEGHFQRQVTELEITKLFIGTFACFNCVVAILLGTQVVAEERSAGTSLFLSRLAISRRHLYVEKIAAGLSGLMVLYVGTFAFLANFDVATIWGEPALGPIHEFFLIMMLSAFGFALLSSKFTQQSIAIMLVSFGAECVLWGVIVLMRGTAPADWHALRVAGLFTLLFFLGPCILVWRQWHLPLRPAMWGTPGQATLLKGFVWKAFAENGLLHVSCFLLLAATVVAAMSVGSVRYDDSLVGTFVPCAGVLLIAALGSSAYSGIERKGLRCVIYHHPVPRGLLFWSKCLVALPAILAVSIALAMTIRADISFLTILVFCVLVYAMEMQTCLTYQSGNVVVILAGLIGVNTVAVTIGMWLTPTENAFLIDGFTPIHDLWLVATLPLALYTTGAVLTAWRLATDRKFLSAPDGYRQRYTLGCFLAVGGFTVAVVSVVQSFVTL